MSVLGTVSTKQWDDDNNSENNNDNKNIECTQNILLGRNIAANLLEGLESANLWRWHIYSVLPHQNNRQLPLLHYAHKR